MPDRKQPNILIFMVDQLTGTLFPDGPADWLHTPNLRKLAQRSTRFANSYTPSPLCSPARASFMTGQLPSGTGVYDNAAPLSADMPTYAHHLRSAGYHTCLSGKMHFVGPDQLHGFEERLTTDIYPGDFGWTPDYRKPGERIDWWYHNMGSVTGAGVAEISNQMEYDDEVAYNATRKIYDLARGKDERPWCLTVSFTHPHDPYVARKKYWDLYEDCEHLLPNIGDLGYDAHDAHSKRIFDANDWRNFDISEEDIRRSRRAYFANVSYLDDKIGDVMEALRGTRQEEDTIILFTSDHGDMLGERGLWFKMSFFEGSSRVPLMISAPQMKPGLVEDPVSLIDICPTLCDLGGVEMDNVLPWTTGESIVPLGQGATRTTPVAMEYAAEASFAPMVSLRQGRYKYNACVLDPEQLFDLEADPNELTNLADDPSYSETLDQFRSLAGQMWDLNQFDVDVRASQARRWVVYDALRKGNYQAWDFQPFQDASTRYMRNHMDLNVVEEDARFPRGE
ncbi:choline-sulfatase [Actibacterium pelagium]|uniref:Choline-sulfatase n=1 Tax=Actibacterium pelagium TaxID=2029103 RepID=A0A917AG92_9RHOB|nr:choline-sulfatase [Actibacterium pelagium]GGE50897.1 choline-sulfatase [Actibacterium pelagium]